MKSITVQEAMEVIKAEMVKDGGEPGSLAHSWHSNIAMMCYAAIKSHEVTAHDEDSAEMSHEDAHLVGNDAASRFMKLCFDVKTKC